MSGFGTEMCIGPPSGVIYLLGPQLAARGHILKLCIHDKDYTIIQAFRYTICSYFPRAAREPAYNKGGGHAQ